MKQLRLPIFNSKIKIYNLRIVPPSSVYNQVMNFKEEFENLHGKQPLSRSKPHITIATFKMNSKHEGILIKVFSQLSQQEPFELHLDGFGVFEGSKTLFVSVRTVKALETLYGDVQLLYGKHLKRKLKRFEVIREPHLTISKTTNKKMLYESLQHFQKGNYSEQIEVGQLTLVSRTKHRTWDWEYHIRLSESKQLVVPF